MNFRGVGIILLITGAGLLQLFGTPLIIALAGGCSDSGISDYFPGSNASQYRKDKMTAGYHP
jgi:hypothetical protein